MNATVHPTVTTIAGRHEHPPHPVAQRHVGVVDRLALQLGVALITWSRRPHVTESRERRATRYEAQRARLLRERESQRRLHLTIPPR